MTTWEYQRQASSSYDATARLAEITVPTLILHGRRDHLAPPILAHELREGIPDSVLVEVPGGHISLVTRQRQRFVNEVREFVTG